MDLEKLTRQANDLLAKELTNLVNRIEGVVFPSQALDHSYIRDELHAVTKIIKSKHRFIVDFEEHNSRLLEVGQTKNAEYIIKRVDWDDFESTIRAILSEKADELTVLQEVKDEIDGERGIQTSRMMAALWKERRRLLKVN